MARIAYFYSSDSRNFHYGAGHPMKPYRVAVTHSIVFAYGLERYMDVFKIKPATKQELTEYHTEEYVDFLCSPGSNSPCDRITDDCPVFEGIGEYCALYSGGSLQAARLLNKKQYEIAINWAGGLHHAKKNGPSGFCYTNDIVLAIQELLKQHRRVMYIDIDIHHGDGVEEAFYHTDRVMTVSFHKYGDKYFPGTGSICCTGREGGVGTAINVPLDFGIDDASYHYVFKEVTSMCIDSYRPEVIVMQCGSDSLAADRIGCFGLSIRGHGECVRHIKEKKIPMLVVGGGGYRPKHVSRCWAYETSVLCGVEIPNEIPPNPHSGYLGENAQLHLDLECAYLNKNTKERLEMIIKLAREILNRSTHNENVSHSTQ
ncbi:histone deacetylase 3 [Nematocida homosporus]|uniref:histone deacetylase 3 n=1 Tax=Nematocida homosporus TaxID=1912981 RepID=UPI00221EF730|nr:histone deacetylase 3 [Nematocida homosporus]KAI5187587.1 histone deacetylase 3 [Nematocida homosporus]